MEFEGSWLVFYTPGRLSEKGEMDSGLSTGMKLVEEVRSGECHVESAPAQGLSYWSVLYGMP